MTGEGKKLLSVWGIDQRAEGVYVSVRAMVAGNTVQQRRCRESFCAQQKARTTVARPRTPDTMSMYSTEVKTVVGKATHSESRRLIVRLLRGFVRYTMLAKIAVEPSRRHIYNP